MCKGTNFISEIGKYFKGNNAMNAMENITSMMENITFSESTLFGKRSKCNCKFSQLQTLQLLLMFPCFMVKNVFNYAGSSLYSIANCGKDVFYRFLACEDYDWRKILFSFSLQLWRKTQTHSERKNKNVPTCLLVDDTDYPKRGCHAEMIGKVFSHVEHKMVLGFKGLFLGITDGASQMLLDFCLVGEKGKQGNYNLKQKQLDSRFTKERDGESHTAKRKAEYDKSKIELTIEMVKRIIAKKIHFDYILADSWFACAEIIKFVTSRHIKCHYLGMIKMGKTKYQYNGKDYTARALVEVLNKSKMRKHSKRYGCFHITADVVFAGRKVRLFFTKRGKNAEWNGLITTNTSLGFLDAYRIYSMRWSLEVVFKDSKSNLGLGKYQMRNFTSQIASTAITAMQYNLLSAARRFSDYETIGGLFKDATSQSIELTVTERIYDLLLEMVIAIAECFDLDDEQVLNAIINDSEKIERLFKIYQQKIAG